MNNKKQIRRIKGISNCFRCGWRTPLNNAPEGCVLEMKNKHEIMKDGYNNCNCERYVTDIRLEKHIKDIMGDRCSNNALGISDDDIEMLKDIATTHKHYTYHDPRLECASAIEINEIIEVLAEAIEDWLGGGDK